MGRPAYKPLYLHEKERANEAEAKAEYYAKRFRAFGSNVETVNPGSGKAVAMEKWEVEWQAWGKYEMHQLDKIDDETLDKIKWNIVESLVSELMESNIVQFIIKGPDECGPWGPLSNMGSVAAKLYVVPWEQMPHSRKIYLMKYAENTLARPKYVEDGHHGQMASETENERTGERDYERKTGSQGCGETD